MPLISTVTATSSGSAAAFEPYEINGYRVEKPLVTAGGGNCKWGFARKYGQEFFIKEFLFPKYPDPEVEMTEKMRNAQIQECNEWFEMHAKVYRAISDSAGGNLVEPRDFFLFQNKFYLVTDKITACDTQFQDLHRESLEQRHMLMKVLAYEFSNIASHGVVHSDIKPNNMILKSTIAPYFTVKVIDFDASFLTTAPPEPDDLMGDIVYYSPEMLRYVIMEEGEITPKSDVFSLGLIFHQILCGALPQFDEQSFASVGEMVLNGQTFTLDPSIPQFYRDLIAQMLELDVTKRLSAMQVLQWLCRAETPDGRIQEGIMREKSVRIAKEPVQPDRTVEKKAAPSGVWHAPKDLL